MTGKTPLNRAEHLALAAAALRGILAGATNAVLTWVLRHLIA